MALSPASASRGAYLSRAGWLVQVLEGDHSGVLAEDCLGGFVKIPAHPSRPDGSEPEPLLVEIPADELDSWKRIVPLLHVAPDVRNRQVPVVV